MQWVSEMDGGAWELVLSMAFGLGQVTSKRIPD